MFQDIKDEVLSGQPLYTIKDSSGNVLNDNVDISLKTPITQEGTPVNRALFRNLQGDLYTQDRYNITTVTQEFLPVDYMTEYIYSETTKQEDFLPKTWTSGGTMTLPSGESGGYFYSDTSSGRFIVMGDNSYTITGSIDRAFDGSTSTMCTYDGSALYAFIVLPKPTRIKKIKLAMGGTGNRTHFSSCTIYGSLDGKSYTSLRSISYNEYKENGYNALSEWTLSTLGYYKYYKVSVYTGDSTWDAYLSEFQVSEYDDTQWGDYFYNHTLDLPLTSYEKGKIVNIEVGKYGSITSMSNCLLNINNLGYKPISDSIDSGKKYSLVYNGASFDILNIPKAQKWILSAGASELKVTNLNETIKIGEIFDIIMYSETSSITGYINEESIGISMYGGLADYIDFRCILCNDNKLHIQVLNGAPRTDSFYTMVIENFTKLNEIRISSSTTLAIGTYIELIRR